MRLPRSRLPLYGLLLQSGLARLSDQMAAVVYGWGLLNETGNSTASSMIMASSLAALVGGTLFAGRLINRFGARAVALSGSWVSVSMASLIALLMYSGFAEPELIAVLAALGAVLDGPASIASETHYPKIARLARFDLIKLNAIDDGLDSAATLVAPASGVFLVTAFGLAAGTAVLALLSLFAALTLTASFPRFRIPKFNVSIKLSTMIGVLIADRLLVQITLVFSFVVGIFMAVQLVVLPKLLVETAQGSELLTVFLFTGGLGSGLID